MRKLIAILALFLVVALAPSAHAGVKKHALAKIASAVVAPVVHPKRTIKETLGVVVAGAEAVVDVVHVGTTALSVAAESELKHNPFKVIDRYVGNTDAYLENVEAALFGSSN